MNFASSILLMGRWLTFGLLLASMVLIGGPSARAQSAPELRATILLRALAFDRKLKARAGDNLVVALVYLASDRASSADRADMRAALGAMGAQKLDGLPLSIVDHRYTTPEALAAAITGGYDVLYVTPGMDAHLQAIKEASRRAQVPTITNVRDYVEAGLSLAVDLVDGRPKLIVNLTASKAEGMDISSQVLQLAEVIR